MANNRQGRYLSTFVGCLISLFASAQELVITHAFFEPFIWQESGLTHGIYRDVMEEVVSQRMGVNVKFVEYPWRRAQQLVNDGLADAYISIPTEERARHTVASKHALATSYIGAFTYANHPRLAHMKSIRRIEDLSNYSLLSYLGNGWAAQHLKGYKVEYGGDSLTKVLEKLKEKRGDLFVHDTVATSHSILRNHWQDDLVQLPDVVFDTVHFHLLLSKHSPFVERLAEFDRHLEALDKAGVLERISQRYR